MSLFSPAFTMQRDGGPRLPAVLNEALRGADSGHLLEDPSKRPGGENTCSCFMPVSFPAVAEGHVMVTDLGSTNGTFIDVEELDAMVKYPLEFGSEFVFGENG